MYKITSKLTSMWPFWECTAEGLCGLVSVIAYPCLLPLLICTSTKPVQLRRKSIKQLRCTLGHTWALSEHGPKAQISESSLLLKLRGGNKVSPSGLGLPLLHCRSVKHISDSSSLLLEELAVLSALLGPGRVKRRGVLVHKMSVLSAPGAAKVLDL